MLRVVLAGLLLRVNIRPMLAGKLVLLIGLMQLLCLLLLLVVEVMAVV